MTEGEWLACTDPEPMLAFLKGKVSDRKLRLFAATCCRRIWTLLEDARSRTAAQMAEEYADALVDDGVRHTAEEYSEAVRSAAQTRYDSEVNESTYAESDEVIADGWALLTAADAAAAAKAAVLPDADESAKKAAVAASNAAEWNVQAGRWAAGEGRGMENEMVFSEKYQQAALVRCIFGPLPFRSASLAPAWLAWNDGTIPKLARAIYDDPAFDRLAVLADALEEAGCDDADILGHLRGPGPHTRGCWPLDLLLGKS